MRRTRHRKGGGRGKPHGHYRASSGIKIGDRMESLSDLELYLALMGTAAEAYAEVDSEFQDWLRVALRTTVTDPEDMALFPEYFPLPHRSMH
jgi:hypothetical protein